MKTYQVLCNVLQCGSVYGKKGDQITLSAEIGDQFVKGSKPKLKEVVVKEPKTPAVLS